jgi:hypothetical protein
MIKLFLVITLAGTYMANPDNYQNKRITIIGVAQDDKDLAIVHTSKGFNYQIDGLDEWEEKYYGKMVKVTGFLRIEEHKKKSTDSIKYQERVGTWMILEKAKWTLVK